MSDPSEKTDSKEVLPKCAGTAPAVLELQPGIYYWCQCGLSDNQPWCNGNHKGTGIKPLQLEITKTTKVALCLCKQSKNGAFCDSSHKNLKK